MSREQEKKKLLGLIEKALSDDDGGGAKPYIFDDEEVAWIKRLMESAPSQEDARHVARSIAMVSNLTDKQIEFLPQLLDGGMFGKRILKWMFWVLVTLGIIVSNLERITSFLKGGS